MDQLGALVGEGARGRRRVASVHRRALHLAAPQPHDLAALEIDGWNNGELFEQARVYDSVPLVDNTPASRGSRAVAWSIARASALKAASMM